MELQEIIRKLGRNKIIIAGDFNAKSVLWFNKETDEKEEKLEEFIYENDLILINKDGNPPTFWTINGSSNIDITLTTKDMRQLIESWEVKDSWTNSNHSCIYFEIKNKNKIKRTNETTKRYNIKSGDWNKFKKLTLEKFDKQTLKRMEDTTPELCSKIFDKKIHEICRKCLKYKKNIERKVPWYNAEIENKRQEVNKSKKRIKTLKIYDKIQEKIREKKRYKQMKKEYNLLIKKSKINSWKDFIKESASKDPWGTAYKVTMEKYRKPEIYHTVKQDSEITEDWETTIKEILNTIAPGNDKTTENIEHKKIIEKCVESIKTKIQNNLSPYKK